MITDRVDRRRAIVAMDLLRAVLTAGIALWLWSHGEMTPGMVAAATPLPVIGVPVPLKYLDGMDSLLSIVQMPGGVPVATVGVGNAKNAGLLAVRILAASSPELCKAMVKYQSDLRDAAAGKGENVRRHSRP